ncbi:MAG: nuclear transport factor 2 family protein [Streptococcaceae bacterium]|nr:nuclear transport factor 2 family protein [Streptococcaceae bacterium]
MDKSEIFQKMINAWLNKDDDEFLSVLTEDVLYTECYGAQYSGKDECEKWFIHWNKPACNQVKSWPVENYYCDGMVGFFTWTFTCVYEGEESVFDGCSLVKFRDDLICEIQEFEQKYEKFRPYKRGK